MGDENPVVRLAYGNSPPERNGTAGIETVHHRGGPGLLVSYVYLKPFLQNRDRYQYRDWALDSGAFSAHNAGTVVDLGEYIATCHELMATDPTLTDIFSLDVIGDHVGSLANTEKMWHAGVPAIPCYHYGEPESALMEMARTYPKIALGGVAARTAAIKLQWAQQCFARVWPKRVHGFAFGGERGIMALPWHSVDATTWESKPCRFGSWHHYGKMSVRGSTQNLRVEVEYYLTLEAKARVKWRKQMAQLDALDEVTPTIRLAGDFDGLHGKRIMSALSLRLATLAGDRENKGF